MQIRTEDTGGLQGGFWFVFLYGILKNENFYYN